jgi:lipopolysaccharide export system protein LptC
LIGVARDFDLYSKAVSWLKLALPIVGLAILSMLFLFARETRIEKRDLPDDLLSPDGAVETVSNPDYSGVTEDGSSVSVIAKTAWPKPDTSGRIEASDLTARFDLKDGERVDVRADAGTLEPDGNILALRGAVVVKTASGWTMETETLDAWLDWTRMKSVSEVHTVGPIGTLDGGEMLIHRDTTPDGTYLMEFDGGVHLVYRP